MQITTYNDAKQFLALTQPLLERHEAANNLILGIAETLSQTPDRYKEWHLWTVDDGSEIKIAAVWTPPFNLAIHVEQPDPAAVSLLAQHLHDHDMIIPGVTGRVAAARVFADSWTALTGKSWHVGINMRVYELRQVIPVQGVDGYMIIATPDHQTITAQWAYAFDHESLHATATLEEANQLVRRHIEQEALYVWCVGDQPVSMAARGRQTRHGAVIGLVYTPPELRGHGYASALVAACSQRILDSGKEFCALFTDLKNPTSNNIYQKIGYRPLEDFDELKFAK